MRTPTQAYPLILLLIALSLPLWAAPMLPSLANSDAASIVRLLGILFVIALFLERALEVFITTWRGPEADSLELDVQAARSVAETKAKANPPVSPQALDEATAALKAAQKAEIAYRSGTQRLALWTGLILGVLISAIGFRTLGHLIDAESFSQMPSLQKAVFKVMDCLITGGLIGGGSEGIHKLTQVYTEFMDASANHFRDMGSTASPKTAGS